MIIIGCDFHPNFQQIAMLDTECGTTKEHNLMHASGEAERFYRALASPALVGIETVGNDQWFVQLLQRLDHEVWIGDAAQIRASYVRKQKTDRRDAGHILKLLIEGRFPRIWVPGSEMRDHRQLQIGLRMIIFHAFLVTFCVLVDTFYAQPWQQRSERFALSARCSAGD
jgi:transposase